MIRNLTQKSWSIKVFAHCAITMRSDVDRVLTGQIQDNSPWEVHKLVHSDDDDELQKSLEQQRLCDRVEPSLLIA